MYSRPAASIAFLGLLLSSGTAALACQCLKIGMGEEFSLLGYESVFRGKVISDGLLVPEQRTEDPVRSYGVFLVAEHWKGPKQPIVVVIGGFGTDCGYPFEKGKEYYVFAERQKGKDALAPRGSLYASTCSPTVLVGEGEAVKKELKKRKSSVLHWSIVDNAG